MRQLYSNATVGIHEVTVTTLRRFSYMEEGGTMASDYNTVLIEEFRANNGKLGGQWANSNLVLVNTVGARSGQIRTIPLAFLQQDNRIYIVGSAAGSESHPAWYFNLLANPDITYELGDDPVDASASLLEGEDRAAAWTDIVAALPFFGDYQTRVSREIPVFVLTPR
jgi:deazaflavin-dependent oxidoreductase (nitroreductase family)